MIIGCKRVSFLLVYLNKLGRTVLSELNYLLTHKCNELTIRFWKLRLFILKTGFRHDISNIFVQNFTLLDFQAKILHRKGA